MVPGVVAAFLTGAFAGPHGLMVGASGPPLQQGLGKVFDSHGAVQHRCHRAAGICVVELPDQASVARLERQLATVDGLRWVERDRLTGASLQALTGDHAGTPDCPDLWELESIGLEAAHERGLRGADAPVVAIQDSGFLASHTDLGQVSGGYDYGDWDSLPEVSTSAGIPHHGTFIAGELVGRADNGVGRAGVLSDGRVNLQKIADSSGALYFSYAVSAMADLAEGDLGVRVLSYSIAGPTYSEAFADAVAALGAADILLVTAAANCSVPDCADADNDAHPMYPGSFADEHVLTVAGSQRDGSLNPYSHYGARSVDLAAPGVDICSLGIVSDEAVLTAGGTSYAAPLVAGAAALLVEAHPALSAVEAARVLRVSAARHPGLEGRVRSEGGLDVAAALSVAVPRLDPLPDPILFDGETDLSLDLTNVGDPGEGTVLITHPAELMVSVDPSTSWTATPFAPGDVLELPDAGAHTAVGWGTLLRGPLARHTTRSLPTTWRASADGEGRVAVRLVASSAGADYLNAPYDSGSPDESGFLALSSTAVYTGAPSDPDPDVRDTAPPDPDEDDERVDSGRGGAGSAADDPVQDSKGGCASAAGGMAAAWGALLGVVGRRRTGVARSSGPLVR